MKKVLSLVLALLLAGCAGPGGKIFDQNPPKGETRSAFGYANPAHMSLAEPVYPQFPQQPVMPLGGDAKEWEAYQADWEKYSAALAALRGGDTGITEGTHAALNAFAAKSTPLVLAGQEGKNATYSPLSLWLALAMLAQCAGGDSRQQVLDALGSDSVDALQDQVEHIWRALYTDDGQSALILANSIWLNSNLQGACVQDTLDILAQKYFAGSYSVPMGTDAADSAIASWVDKQTNGLIGGDQPFVETEPDILALLVSSLYYKTAWQKEFREGATAEDIFTDANLQEIRADFMHKTEQDNFIRRDGYQAARLKTHLGEMIFVLPDKGAPPESLLNEPDFLSRLEFCGDACIWGEVQWSVPKFDINSDLELMDSLTAMGITHLSDPDRADLSSLTRLDAFLSDARQLARVKVDEEGVEAAAVTILTEAPTCAPPEPSEVCVMDLDRPFLFVIRTQDVPLFIGVVNQF